MERVGTLINKLKEQFEQQVEPNKLVLTVQMLLSELQQKQTVNANGKVSVTMPSIIQTPITHPAPEPLILETKLVEPEPVIEEVKEIVPEPAVVVEEKIEKPKIVEPISAVAELQTQVEASYPIFNTPPKEAPVQEQTNSSWLFDSVVTTVPTLAQQDVKEVFELNETMVADVEVESHNDKLKEQRVEVAAVLQGTPIKDLKKAIGINDRYLFINELFRGDEAMYERSIKTINSFSIYPEAEYWIQREMKTKLGWLEDTEAVKLFDQLVKRRFS